ncbi:GDNF-inducible zinc finger protein 1-like [Vanessa atalanta]|uniref:GDNF-inducible zinc finger protein 1-like n=1 Tax=Vanessa atalanta TaxID=42275 RepID=UPI001FCDDBAD|nr:GDNF-inducible zinc finger protein 1-like [Vanessa atalanta]
MRTYTRKRSEYQLIEGVHEMCRLCLEKVKETVPIFTDTDNVCASLTMRIMMCVGLQITREDCLPDMICTECHKELNNYYEFKKKCVLTYQKLKSHLLAVKQSGTKKDTDLKVKQEQNETQNLSYRLGSDNVEPALDVKETQHLEVNIDVNGLSCVSNEHIEKPSTELSTSNEIPENQDVSEFLSSILSELGILTRDGDQALMMDQNLKLIEIETGDKTKMILELLEIDEGQQNSIKNEASNNQINIQSTIKYIDPLNIDKNVMQPKDERARCPQCGKRFATRGALRRHARVHSGERPYVCTVCARAFAQREVLRRHELVHGEEKPFKCAQCGKGFTQRGALTSHTRAHAAPDARALALHRCSRCPKVFLHASGLSRHTMMHNGRVYACGACERRFSDKSSLLRHLRAKHAAAAPP